MEQEHFEALYPDTTRSSEIEKIISYIKEGSSCQLLGLPGAGRSTLLSLLAHNRQIRIKHFADAHTSVHFVMANFSEIRKRSLFDTMKFLFLTLTESLRERKMLEENKVVGDIFREHLQFHDELILFQGFKEAVDYLCLDKKITLVFLFDRFEEYIPTVTDEFFTNLRTLRNRGKYKFSIVFSLYRPLETFLEPDLLADYYEFVAGHVVYLPLFDQEATSFRVAYIEKVTGKHVSEAVLKEIIKLCGGSGRLIKLSVEAVLAHGETPQNLSLFLLKQKTVSKALQEIWSVFSPAEQIDLLKEIFDDKETEDYLEQIGIVKDRKIQIPLFAQFIHEEYSSVKEEKATIRYDQNTNTIAKGNDVLSDQLTASEFRLLRYLLQNTQRVVEREELITIVWEGNKSTAGITDQAVDQLIFRLRRKIEEDANNPQHLQTVKGRGFRFVA
ncbi:MAG TPA: helix-turn-helix domain-containing protein [Methylomirabilota bacterium]|nr:helix-turn-helix domain-containing protein [Methylomirabilota bacterium]